MEIKSLNCPNCGGSLNVEDLDVFFCKYCGNKIILSGLSDAAYKARVDVKKIELQASEMEHKYQYAHEKLHHESATNERVQKSKSKHAFTALVIILLVVFIPPIVGISMLFLPDIVEDIGEYKEYRAKVSELELLSDEIEQCIESGDYEQAISLTDDLHLDRYYGLYSNSSEWDKRRAEYIERIRELQREDDRYTFIYAPLDCTEVTEYSKIEMIEIFEDAGFENIQTEQVNGRAGFFSDPNLVQRVTIDGDSEFTERDSFIEDAEIVIYYYKK